MFDIAKLEDYTVVLMGDTAPGSVKDLRVLEGPFGSGVYPLFSDDLSSVVAVAFEPAMYTQEQADKWVADSKTVGLAATQAATGIAARLNEMLAPLLNRVAVALGAREQGDVEEDVAARSFSDIRSLLDTALGVAYPQVVSDGYSYGPWIVDLGADTVLVELETGAFNGRYAIPYTIDENDAVVLGTPEEVVKQWVRSDGSPLLLHAFALQLGDGTAADDTATEEDEYLVWKEILHPGTWHKTDTGRSIEITAEMIEAVFTAWENGLPKLISVPSDSHHDSTGGIVPVEDNRGFVRKLMLIDGALYGGFEFTDPWVAVGVQTGSIADVSVYLQPNIIHPTTGDAYAWALQHVLLTNNPLVQDLQPFGAVPMSGAGGELVIGTYTQQNEVKGGGMPELPEGTVAMSAEDAARLTEFAGLGLSVADIKAMAAAQEAVTAAARGLEIIRIVRALEGKEAHDSVVPVEGYCHYPVVCAAVEAALRDEGAALGLSVVDGGKTSFDAVLLGVVNAIPQEGRMALAVVDGPEGNKDPKDEALDDTDGVPTDEQIAELDKRLS